MHKTELECADPVVDLERFCAELGRELETVQRERTATWEKNQRLRKGLKAVAEIAHLQKPPVAWRDLTLEAIRIAKAALGDKK